MRPVRLKAILFLAGCLIWHGIGLCAPAQGPSQIREQFSRLCIEHFGAEKEGELYRAFGKQLQIVAGSRWQYVSESSACIAWQTNLPAETYVEYGPSAEYGSRTSPPERHFFVHVHYLTNLRPSTTYHFRLVGVDERGNQVRSEDQTLFTKRMSGAVRVPDGLSGPPYLLDRADTVYLVTKDIVADATALNIAADGVTLDLGGHTIVYDEKAGAVDPSAAERLYGWHSTQNPCGLRTADRRGRIKVINGTIRQGSGNGASKPSGFNPLFLRRPRDTEVAGVTVVYSGSQVTGILVNNAYDGVHVHHNVLVDEGAELFNRHRGLDGIHFGIGREAQSIARCHHNLIKRTRHRGITTRSNTELFANEIYVDSYATNSYGIMYYSSRDPIHDVSLHHNLIFGTGYHPVGIGAGFHARDIRVQANYIQMQGLAREERWQGGAGGGDPAGQLHPVNGIRLHKGPQQNIEYRGNTIVVKGRGKGCMMRGLWLIPKGKMEGIVLRDNLVKLIAEDREAEGHAVAALGTTSETADETLTLIGNTIISNLCHVRFGDNYGHGGRYRLIGNRFVKVGDDPRYKTIRLGWQGWKYETFGHVFVDSVFEGGAAYDSVSFDGIQNGRYSFSVGWQLDLKTIPGAAVRIKDRTGAEVSSGRARGSGKMSFMLFEYSRERGGRTMLTPHTVIVERDGGSTSKSVLMDRKREIEIK